MIEVEQFKITKYIHGDPCWARANQKVQAGGDHKGECELSCLSTASENSNFLIAHRLCVSGLAK